MNQNTDGRSELAESANSEFSKRLIAALNGESIHSLAKRSGINDSTLRKYMNGSMPGLDKLIELADALGVSLDWLAAGKGERRAGASSSRSLVISSDDVIAVPYLDVMVSAGNGAGSSREEVMGFVPFPRTFLRELGLKPDSAKMVTVVGDSMEPTLLNNDIVLVDTTARRITNEAIYILVLDGEVYVKRARRRMDGSVLVISDNDRYPVDEFKEDQAVNFSVAGRVVWYGRAV